MEACKNGTSRIFQSEMCPIQKRNAQLSQQLDPQEVDKKLAQDTREPRETAGANTSKGFEMVTPEERLRTVSERPGFVRTVSKRNVPQNWPGCGRWIWEFYGVMPRVHFLSDPSRF